MCCSDDITDEQLISLTDEELEERIEHCLDRSGADPAGFAAHPVWDPRVWHPAELKLEELDYFFELMRANTPYARVFLFTLSAFLAAARALTLYLQAHAATQTEAHAAAYQHVRREYLSDDLARFCLQLRNDVLHAGYPQLDVEVYREDLNEDGRVRLEDSLEGVDTSTRDGLAAVQMFIDQNWDTKELANTGRSFWNDLVFRHAPLERKSVLEVCGEYRGRLHSSLRRMKYYVATEYAYLVPGEFDTRLIAERQRRRRLGT